MIERWLYNLQMFFDSHNKKIYQCSCCQRIEAPFLFKQNIIDDYGWAFDSRKGWVCKSCFINPPQTEEEKRERIEANAHHNLVVKNRLMKTKYGKKYQKKFA